MRYSNKVNIYISDTNAKGVLSLINTANIIQNSSNRLFKKIGIDQITMNNKFGYVWVVTRTKIQVYDEIPWDKTIEVESYITSKTSVRMVVDTAFKNKEGSILIYAKVETCLFDLNENKIKRITDDLFEKPFEILQPEKPFNYEGFDSNLEYTLCDEITVRSNNIDFCCHTNNVEYIRFIMGAYPVEEIIKTEFTDFEIKYLSQTYEKDKLKILKNTNDGVDNFIIINNDTEIVKCRIKTKKNI